MLKQLLIDTGVFEDAARFDAAFEMLPAVRKEKILKYRFPEDQRLSLGVGVLLEEAIKDAGLKTEAAALHPEILEGPQGKPYLKGFEDRFQFSLSHSGTFAFCVYAFDPVGPVPAVGCDIEKIGTANFGIAERFFSPEEKAFLNTLSGEEKNTAFYRLWTLKESILKADGRGTKIPLDSFTVRISEDKKTATDFSPAVSLFEDAIPGYRLAWCTLI